MLLVSNKVVLFLLAFIFGVFSHSCGHNKRCPPGYSCKYVDHHSYKCVSNQKTTTTVCPTRTPKPFSTTTTVKPFTTATRRPTTASTLSTLLPTTSSTPTTKSPTSEPNISTSTSSSTVQPSTREVSPTTNSIITTSEPKISTSTSTSTVQPTREVSPTTNSIITTASSIAPTTTSYILNSLNPTIQPILTTLGLTDLPTSFLSAIPTVDPIISTSEVPASNSLFPTEYPFSTTEEVTSSLSPTEKPNSYMPSSSISTGEIVSTTNFVTTIEPVSFLFSTAEATTSLVTTIFAPDSSDISSDNNLITWIIIVCGVIGLVGAAIIIFCCMKTGGIRFLGDKSKVNQSHKVNNDAAVSVRIRGLKDLDSTEINMKDISLQL